MNKKAACTIVQTALAPTRGFEPPKCRSALRARIALTALADAGIGNRADLTGGRRFARNKKAACTIVQTALAPTRGFEPPTYRLGATSFGSCLVVRHASKCPQTRMNTGFFIELPVAEYLKISPNIGSFCTQIEPAIRQILDRFSAVTPNTGDSLELSYPII